jgi:hypothetical protein
MKKSIGLTLIKGMRFSSAVLALLVIFITITSESASAQVKEEWVARYNGPGNSRDSATALALDAAGNVYVTGTSFSGIYPFANFSTIKYDNSGNELWVARYRGDGLMMTTALALDAAGNVYVTGTFVVSTGQFDNIFDYFTIKLVQNGSDSWGGGGNGGNGGCFITAIIN